LKCALCEHKECYSGKDCTKIQKQVKEVYSDSDIKSTKVSTWLEANYYMKKTRLEELILYSKEMGYTKLGLAFCVGLSKEAKIIHKILEREFEVHSVCCKVCGIDKTELGLEKLHLDKDVDAMCNPIGQAMILNEAGPYSIVSICTGCLEVMTTPYPETAWEVPIIHAAFERCFLFNEWITSIRSSAGLTPDARALNPPATPVAKN